MEAVSQELYRGMRTNVMYIHPSADEVLHAASRRIHQASHACPVSSCLPKLRCSELIHFTHQLVRNKYTACTYLGYIQHIFCGLQIRLFSCLGMMTCNPYCPKLTNCSRL